MPDTVNPNIPLQAGRNIPSFGPDYNQLLVMQRLAQAQQEQQGYDALRQLYANPQNLGPNGQPTPQALGQLMSVAPRAGMDLTKSLLQDQAMTAQATQLRLKEGDEIFRQKLLVGETALEAYRDAKTQGLPDDAARKAGQDAWSSGRKDLAAAAGPTALATFPTDFDPVRVARGVSAGNQALLTPIQRQEMVYKAQDERRKDEELGIRKTELGIKRDEATTKQFDKPLTVAVPDPKTGQLEQKSARFDKVMNQFVEIGTGAPLPGAQIVPPNQVMPGVAGGASEAGGITGEEYLKSLPKADADQIKALADGRMQFPGGFALRSPFWQNRLLQVSQYDPSFDTINYGSRAKTRNDFTSGQSARNITSFNTAIGHLGTLSDAVDKLGNSWSPTYNTIANFVISQKGDPRVKEFQTARQAVSDELERAFRGTGGNVTGIQEWQRNLDTAGSPAMLKGSIKTAVDLLASRIEAVGEQYQRGMGKTSDPLNLLSTRARETLKKLPGGEALSLEMSSSGKPAEGAAGATAGAAQPQAAGTTVHLSGDKAAMTKQWNDMPSGTYYTLPDGSSGVKP